MAERRMFSKSVIDSDIFMDLPFGAQAVYLHLAIRADDDGFVGNARSILRMVGGTEEEYGLLLERGYIRDFDSGVAAIVHWKVHNYIQKDRYKPTIYRAEKALMYPEDSDADPPVCAEESHVSKMDTQVRIGKVREDKVRQGEASSDKASSEKTREDTTQYSTDTQGGILFITEPVTPKRQRGAESVSGESYVRTPPGASRGLFPDECVEIMNLYNNICTRLTLCATLTDTRAAWIKETLRRHRRDEIEQVFRKAQNCDFLCGKGDAGWKASLDWLLKEDNFIKVKEGAYDRCVSSSADSSYDLEAYEKTSIFD